MPMPSRTTHLSVLAVLAAVAGLLLAPPASAAAKPKKPTKVLVVMEENHSYAQARAGMPYLKKLAKRYGYATRSHAVAHPSLPNYVAIAGGDTFGISTDTEAIPSPKIGKRHSVLATHARVPTSLKTG